MRYSINDYMTSLFVATLNFKYCKTLEHFLIIDKYTVKNLSLSKYTVSQISLNWITGRILYHISVFRIIHITHLAGSS